MPSRDRKIASNDASETLHYIVTKSDDLLPLNDTFFRLKLLLFSKQLKNKNI